MTQTIILIKFSKCAAASSWKSSSNSRGCLSKWVPGVGGQSSQAWQKIPELSAFLLRGQAGLRVPAAETEQPRAWGGPVNAGICCTCPKAANPLTQSLTDEPASPPTPYHASDVRNTTARGTTTGYGGDLSNQPRRTPMWLRQHSQHSRQTPVRRAPPTARATHAPGSHLGVCVVGVPRRAQGLLPTDVPHQEARVVHHDLLHVAADGG